MANEVIRLDKLEDMLFNKIKAAKIYRYAKWHFVFSSKEDADEYLKTLKEFLSKMNDEDSFSEKDFEDLSDSEDSEKLEVYEACYFNRNGKIEYVIELSDDQVKYLCKLPIINGSIN